MQAMGSTQMPCTSMTPSLACLLGEVFADPSISPGKERDAESGLDFFGTRYLNSGLGRWMSPDPKLMSISHVISPQKWNKYAYVQNNPLLRFDPNGMYNDPFIPSAALEIAKLGP
jgi:RHS repeat-associated protein